MSTNPMPCSGYAWEPVPCPEIRLSDAGMMITWFTVRKDCLGCAKYVSNQGKCENLITQLYLLWLGDDGDLEIVEGI